MDSFSVSGWMIYLITRLDSLKEFFCILAAISFIVIMISIVVTIFSCMESASNLSEIINEIKDSVMIKYLKRTVVFLAIVGTLQFITPTSKEMLAIWLVPTVANNSNIQEAAKEVIKLPKNILEGTNTLLESWINEKTNKESVKK